MKKFFLFALLVISASHAGAQVTALDEHFNTFCVIQGENYPTYWSEFDIYSNPSIAWSCDPVGGRNSSPGIGCNNFDGSTYYVDTAWLFTPQLNLSYYTGNIYLNFDTKYTANSGRLALMLSTSYAPGGVPGTGQVWEDVSSASSPIVGNYGNFEWETHQVDLTPYASAPLFVAFRYTSDVIGSGKWMLDNVRTTQTVLGVSNTEDKKLPLTVIGSSTAGHIDLSYTIAEAGRYSLSIYDMVGREVYKEEMAAQSGAGTHTINNVMLHSGMYLVKMSNGTVYGTTKAIIP